MPDPSEVSGPSPVPAVMLTAGNDVAQKGKGPTGFMTKIRGHLLGPKTANVGAATFVSAGALAGVSALAMGIGMALGAVVTAAAVATPIGWAALGIAAVGILILICIHLARKSEGQATNPGEEAAYAFIATALGFLAIPVAIGLAVKHFKTDDKEPKPEELPFDGFDLSELPVEPAALEFSGEEFPAARVSLKDEPDDMQAQLLKEPELKKKLENSEPTPAETPPAEPEPPTETPPAEPPA